MRLLRLLSIFLLALCAAPVRAALPDPVSFSVALERGDIELARRWLDAGLPPDFEGSTIGSGLMIGAWEGNLPLVILFHERGADVNKTNALGEQALLHAAWRGHLEVVRWLLDHGARVSREGKAWSALHYAVFAGHEAVARELVARGADVNGRSTNGSTPLMMAAREGHESLATRLLAAGARADLVNDAGEDAAQWAMRHNHPGIARAVAGAAQFARMAARSVAAPPPRPAPRSQPVPDPVERLFQQARRLEGAGRRDEALTLYRQALAAIKGAGAPAPQKAVSGIVITARRGDAAAQGLQVTYAAPARAAAEPAPADPAEEWLAKARALEAAGKRAEALAAFRQAAAALRQ